MHIRKRFLFAILTLVTTLTFSACDFSAFLPQKNSSTSSNEQDILLPPPDTPTSFINSLDKLNYYAVRKTMEDYLSTKSVSAGGYDEDASGESVHGSHQDSETSETTEQDTHSEMPTDSISDRPQDTEDKRYYDLYDWGAFTVKHVIYFQMELSGENTFLTSRLGAGIVEVAISIGDVHDDLNMITFRNGEKFFSCMFHGYWGINQETGAEKYAFAAYRYIEGFYYVKNLKYEHFEFYVEVDKVGDAVFTCDYQHTGTKEDIVSVIQGSTHYVDKEVTYTIEELESYFNPSASIESGASEWSA